MENAHKKVLESRDGGGEGWRSTLLLPLPLKFARPGKSWIQEQVLESHGKSWNTHVKKVLRRKTAISVLYFFPVSVDSAL